MNEDGPTWWDAFRWWMIIPIIISAIGGVIVARYLRKDRKKRDEETTPDQTDTPTQIGRLTRTQRAKKFKGSAKRKRARHTARPRK